MKTLIIELDPNWILTHKDAPKFPTHMVEDALNAMGLKAIATSFTRIVVESETDISAETLRNTVFSWLEKEYQVAPELKESLVQIREPGEAPIPIPFNRPGTEVTEAAEPFSTKAPAAEAAAESKADAMMTSISAMLGAADFIDLCQRLCKVAPLMRDRLGHILMGRSYLFAIDDGYGMTTALKKFNGLLIALGIGDVRGDPAEVRLPAPSPSGPSPLEKAGKELSSAQDKLICIDIRDWADKVSTPEFRDFLQELNRNRTCVYIFRTPYLERDALMRIESALADVMTVETISFVPLATEELTIIARELLASYDFRAGEAVWDLFCQRLAEERSDGRFYGIKTVRKVVDEMVYRKLLESGAEPAEITPEDLRGFVHADTTVSAAEMMGRLVGIDAIRDRIEEIVNQIEFARSKEGVNPPAMHMRFVGNPGTGKTTVARIVGQLLKERGILSKGYFFEHTGGDFIGMYVGHTAPKTLALCRDAYGSVLFIDEAYTLADANYSSGSGFAKEAVDTLIAQMENHREDMVVIMAGYPKEMQQLMEMNPGLAGRIPYELIFPNYSREDLYNIFLRMAQSDRFTLTPEANASARDYFHALPDSIVDAGDFANARFVRNLFERTWSKSVMRSQLDGSDPMTITAADFDTAAAEDIQTLGKKQARKSRPGYKLGLV